MNPRSVVGRAGSHILGIMLSQLRCLARAAQCEAMARTSKSYLGQRVFLALASLWRKLAEQARRFERPTDGP